MERIQVALEQNDGGKTVHRLRAFLDADAALLEDALGRHGCEPLVPELDLDTRASAQARRKIARVFRLPAFSAAHVKRIAHQYQRDVLFHDELREALDVFPNVRALERLETLRGDAKLIADRQADAAFSEV